MQKTAYILIQILFFSSYIATTAEEALLTSSATTLLAEVREQQRNIHAKAQTWFQYPEGQPLPDGIGKTETAVVIQMPYPYFDVAGNFVAFAMLYNNSNQQDMNDTLREAGLTDIEIESYAQAVEPINLAGVSAQLKERLLAAIHDMDQESELSDFSNKDLGILVLRLQEIRSELNAELFSTTFSELKRETQEKVLQHLKKSFANQTYIIQMTPDLDNVKREETLANLNRFLNK